MDGNQGSTEDITVKCLCAHLPVFRGVGQWDNYILVDEDEESQEEAKPHGTDYVHSWQPLKRSHIEDGPVMNLKHWNCPKNKSYVNLLCLFIV